MRRPAVEPPARGGARLVFAAARWAALAAVFALFLQSLFHHGPGFLLGGAVVALIVISAMRPAIGLLVLAAAGPLSAAIYNFGASARVGIQFAEALTLAFLIGYAVHRTKAARATHVSPALSWCALMLAAVTVASALTEAAVMRRHALDLSLAEFLATFVTRDYLRHLAGSAPLTTAMLLCEGCALLIAAADLVGSGRVRRRPVLTLMIAGAAAAGALNLLRLVNAAVARERAWEAFVAYLTTLRVNVQYGDLNAAGAYFAMAFLLALGFVVARRWIGVVSLGFIAAGLWITGSRAALAAVAAVTLATLVFRVPKGGKRGRAALAAAGFAACLLAAAWALYPSARNAAVGAAFGARVELARTAVRMTGDHPVTGVGISRYYDRSEEYGHDLLLKVGAVRENAHNYYLQVLAELGIPGFLLLLAVLWLALRPLIGDAYKQPIDVGLLGGLSAYLLACLVGHPLLVPEASYPFWLALGLAAAPVAGLAAPAPRWLRRLALALCLVLAATLPYRMLVAYRNTDLAGVSVGFSQWQRLPDGTRYRWAGPRSTFFISSAARAVRIPMQAGPDAPGVLDVSIRIDGREADRVRLTREEPWRTVRIVLSRRTTAPSMRVEVAAAAADGAALPESEPTDRSGVLMIGRPFIEAPEPGGRRASAVPDFNRDGSPDLLWRNAATGENIVWFTRGAAYASYARLDSLPGRDWRSIGTADFNGDGHTDILWRNVASGENKIWYMTGTARSGETRLDSLSPEWALGAVADLDRDGHLDLVWRNRTKGKNLVWYLDGATRVREGTIGTVEPDWQLIGAGDFNGDQYPDLVWHRAASGETIVWFLHETTYVGHAPLERVSDAGWQPALVQDFDADGMPDLFWRNNGTGENIIWLLDGSRLTAAVHVEPVHEAGWRLGSQQLE